MQKFYVSKEGAPVFEMSKDPVAWAGVALLVLALLMLVEAVIALLPREEKPNAPQLAVS